MTQSQGRADGVLPAQNCRKGVDFDFIAHQDRAAKWQERGKLKRLGMIIYQIFRFIALGTAGYGAYKGFYAPEFKMWVFMLFCAPAIVSLLIGRLFRRVMVGY